MAAKPTKPPGNFLKSLLNQHINKNQHLRQQQNNDDDSNKESNSRKDNLTTTTVCTEATNHVESDTSSVATKHTNCNCSNISIMHLFHEMKQEFPTLGDTIVAQCVNENCHQRENCIQMLKHELELNPIPAQSYPAKVLHPSINNLLNSTNHNDTATTTTASATSTTSLTQKPPLQQKPFVVQQKPPLKPIKPIRAAPLQPALNQQQNSSNNNSTKINPIVTTNSSITEALAGEDLHNTENAVSVGFVQSTTTKTTTTNLTSPKVCNGESFDVIDVSNVKTLPRQRPTTLNLNTQQQQQRQRLNIQLQQRFQEQRNRQQQQNSTIIIKPLRKAPLPPTSPKPSQLQTSHSNTNAANSFLNDSLLTNNTTTSPLSESEISVSVSLSTPSPTSSSPPNAATHLPFNKPIQTPTVNQQHSETKSPIRHRSVITLQPEPPYARDFLCTPASLSYASSAPLASPLAASSATTNPTTATISSLSINSSPTTSVAGSPKSFTSVNLTLRPPVSQNSQNFALQPSTIDITAGPGFSGASGGGNSLHYSSTSYDARLGYQQKFQITVTDECGVFTASRIRPQQNQQQQSCLNQVNIKNENNCKVNSGNATKTNQYNYSNSFLNVQQQQQQYHNNNVVALQQNIQNSIQSPQTIGDLYTSSGFEGNSGGENTSVYLNGSMCLPSPRQATDALTQEILQRQMKKRDKLAAALREYKNRLGNVEQEINLLTGSIPTKGLSERLDDDITKLRRDCQDMLRSSNTFTQPLSQQELAINHQAQQQTYQQQQERQPFPRQRVTRPPPRPPPPRQTSLDIIQHHSQTSTPPVVCSPNLNMYNSLQQLQQQQLELQNQTNYSLTTPPYYQQQSAPLNTNLRNNNNDLFDGPDLVADDVDDYDEYEEVVEPWECNMCTFRNHPQLNICETCENVRIIPGRLTNLNNRTNATAAPYDSPSLGLLRSSRSTNAINNISSSTTNGLTAGSGNLEHETSLVQQQLQHFALHT